jgi:Domain of unknown function (DUF4332)
MAVVFSLLRSAHARGTHHELALDALGDMRGPAAAAWQRLFYNSIALYLDGAKAPDKAFKDFQNHVLHPRHGFWGGATAQAETWYTELVSALRRQDWPVAAYAAGVLSHYCTDPLQPLHTHQTDAESNIHAAVEWTVSKSYVALRELGLSQNPELKLGALDRADWLQLLIRAGAERATTHYETILAHYDIKRGVVAPEEGLDLVGRRAMAEMVVYASRMFAVVLDRAIAEAAVTPPEVDLVGAAMRAWLSKPKTWWDKRGLARADRRVIEAIYDELMATGQVSKSLPEDDKLIRDVFAREVLAREVLARVPAPRVTANQTVAGSAAISDGRVTVAQADDDPRLDPPELADATAVVDAKARVPVPQPRPAPRRVAAPAARRHAETVTEVEAAPDAEVAAKPAVEAPAPVEPAVAVASSEALPTAALPAAPAEQSAAVVEPKPIDLTTPSIAAFASVDQAGRAAAVGFASIQVPAAAAAVITPALSTYRPSARTGLPHTLSLEADVVDAPSIGPRIAQKLNAVGIDTVGDFLKAHPIALASRLQSSLMTPEVLAEWQDQTRLMCELGELRATQAKLLVSAGYKSVDAIAAAEPDQLSADVLRYALTKEGQRLLRDGHVPDIEQIRAWATAARSIKAA